ncbi:MAG: hypothetical protein KA213_00650, partial [Flavobacterium sp.]|nr:hypothetical protein [Flavobacterium sp.]
MKNNYPQSRSFLQKMKFVLTLVLFCISYALNAQSPSVFTYTGTAQTWVCPQGVTSIQVEAIGGGGGGISSCGSNGCVGGGGGGGAYARRNSITVVPGTTYTISAAAIGNGGGPSAVGSTTSLTINGVTITAAGGGIGQASGTGTRTGGAGGLDTASSGDVTLSGGNGGSGFGTSGGGGNSAGGGGGSAAGSSGPGSPGGNAANNSTPGVGGLLVSNYGGAGGAGAYNDNGFSATGNYGGGGGGAGHKGKTGGSGRTGAIIISFTCPTNTIANAGPNQSLLACATTTTLAGNAATYGTGTWTLISGAATITSPNSPTSTVTGITIGNPATLRWTIDNGRCGSTFDDVVISTGVGCWTYCTPSVTNLTPSFPITSVSFNTINNASTATTGYENFSSISTTVTAGYSYTLTVLITGLSPNPHYTSVWFDWNNNGTFDVGEETQLGTNTTSSNAFTTTITIPSTAVIGNTRMRVINRVLTGYAPACGPITYGQFEDYTVNIVSPPACVTPTAQPTAIVLSPSGTSLAGSFTAASPAPNNYLVYVSQINSAPTLTNGTTYSTGAFGSGFIVDLDSNTSFVATGLTVSTLYYIFVFSYNSICSGTTPTYFTTSPLTGSTTTLATSYCIPTGSLDCTSGDYIANVTFNTLNNSSTCAPGGYINYAPTGTQTTTLIRGNTFNLSIGTGPANKKHGAAVWIDYNQNGVFETTEGTIISNNIIANSINTIAITIPLGATLGQTRMRIRYAQKVTVTTGMPCTMTGSFGETEDYTITLADPIICVAPTTQPTALILTPTGTTITGSFTAASPAPNNYLVVYNTTGTTPSPVNTISYTTIGGAVPGGFLADNDANTSFVINGLSTLTTYYVFVFSFNSICSGGPTYNTVSPLNGSITTITTNYCTPSVTSGREDDNHLIEVSFIGTLNDVSNYSTYSSSPLGYQDFTTLTNLAKQAQGEGVNVSIQALYSSFVKAWVDWNKDGLFDNTTEIVYNSGTISTGSTTFGFIIPAGQALGNYRIRIRVDLNGGGGSTTFTSCGNLNNGGESEDYLFTVVANCNATIATITEGRTCGPGTVDLEATSSVVVPAVSEY